MPWRADRDPYRVWISEAMLQQTRVEAVVPYFERFVARFPNVAALASAPLDDVLAAWSGLGYYSRARTLHATARAIAGPRAGVFPSTVEELRGLPGIGPYTAGAIASIAFDVRAPLVDGNVARVLCRVLALAGDPASSELKRALWAHAEELLPARSSPGEWNQALMELGALVCVPRVPRCSECPVAADCRAFAAGLTRELPWPKARREPIDVELTVLAVARGGAVLLEQRPSGGRMASLWQLPTIQRSPREPLLFPAEWPAAPLSGRPLLQADASDARELRHAITHHRIRAELRRGRTTSATLPDDMRFVGPLDVAGLALTGMAKKALRVLAAWDDDGGAAILAPRRARVRAVGSRRAPSNPKRRNG